MLFRGFLHFSKAFHFVVVLLCSLFTLITYEISLINGAQNQMEFEACRSFKGYSDENFPDLFDDHSKSIESKQLGQQLGMDNVCPHSNSFCFPSTLAGFLCEENDAEFEVLDASRVHTDVRLSAGLNQVKNILSRSSDSGTFRLLDGMTVSCSLYYQESYNELPCLNSWNDQENDVTSRINQLLAHETRNLKLTENIETVKSGFLDSFSTPHVEIKPSLLDWGQKYLYFPSLAFLTVKNIGRDNILNVYEPYSSNSQFYSCNVSEILLSPGEVASVCFVFLPTKLGSSSTQLVLQTSFGGFLIPAIGSAVESPYGVKPLIGLGLSSSRRWRKNLSLFNPFDEALYVEEVAAWLSISSGNTSHSSKAICRSIEESSENHMLSAKEWLDAENGEVGLPQIAMRPHKNWEIRPQKTETIMELDLSFHFEGKVFGAICMQLLRSSKNKTDTIIVPLEAQLNVNSGYDEPIRPVSVSLEAIMPCLVLLSVRNDSPYVLSVTKVTEIGENTANFHIKYMEGLVLFPDTVTQVAVIVYSPLETPKVNMNCKLVILINDTSSQIEIPCEDVISIGPQHELYSSIEYRQQSRDVEHTNAHMSLSSGMQLPSEMKAVDAREAEELVLRNWKSHAATNFMSVLDENEVLFPMVQVGSHWSQWISVKNPSQKSIVMQLVLNSGEIIDECRTSDTLLQLSSSNSLVGNKSTAQTRYGFSIAESAVTEAFVHPYGKASIGPILFRPSNRCEWKSSVLIRNNLSGVEWLSLRGFGGLVSLVLFEEASPLQGLEFKLNLPTPLSFLSSDTSHYMEDKSLDCSVPLMKELYAKNTGDLPLEVKRIEVSGAKCGMDGFLVNTCKGFSLLPGESIKLKISYQTDFSTATIQRDLQLVLASGIFVIPMKAFIPMSVLYFCKRSTFWIRVKRSMVAILFSIFILLLLLFFLFPHVMAFGFQEYLFKSVKSSISTESFAEKCSNVHHNPKNHNKYPISPKMSGLISSNGKEDTLLESDGQAGAQKHVNLSMGYQKQTNTQLNTQQEAISSLSSLSKPVSVEPPDIQDASKARILPVKIGKGKGRRRRKNKSSNTALSGLFEVSSSQSGNSTPTSPFSPVTSVEAKHTFTQVADQQCDKSTYTEPHSKVNALGADLSLNLSNSNWLFSGQGKPNLARKVAGRAVLLPSATFPIAGRASPHLTRQSPILASTSTIASHARAPGSKLHDKKPDKVEQKIGIEENYTYDIWGDHLFGLPLTGRSKEDSSMSPHATESSSESFFMSGPQTLITNSQLQPVSAIPEG
ncbi:Hypothetical predicted protein [Olea europaea subsp. europaea]|uniref:Transmembrane protein 131-like N-terminal domain-containing protein n=1 Tax=Olea europaea subsp. europaea TaxID=158383 RepID=A0A8S0SXS9_OLEEU|nr:Hypothetical predicted protein [Olea europaea subsp. europaea]